MNIIEKLSPNCDSRDGQPIDMLVLHYTGMKTMQEALNRLCDPAAKVSVHYMVDEDGTVYKLVPEDKRAWHAGVSSWRGHDNINQRSIGIEIVNPGHEFGYRPFPKAQMEAVVQLCKEILSRHKIPARNVVAHSDIAPSRKEDPGELFDWKWLAKQKIGLCPQLSLSIWEVIARGVVQLAWSSPWLGFFDFTGRNKKLFGSVVNALPSYNEVQAQLAQYGYNCPQTGALDEETGKIIIAFQRHFYPKRLTGVWDRECAMQLASLLKLI